LGIFMVENYVVRPEKQTEFTAWMKKYLAWVEKHPQLFKEVKSHKLFAQIFGGSWGGYVEMWEFKNLAECERCFNRVMQDKEYMKTLYAEAMSFVAPGTHSMNIWNPVT